MKKYFLLDTNIFRRLIEYQDLNNESLENKNEMLEKKVSNTIERLNKEGYFYVSDQTIFELLAKEESKYNIIKKIFKKYKIYFLASENNAELVNSQYVDILEVYNVTELKIVCFKSFLNSIVNILIDLELCLILSTLSMLFKKYDNNNNIQNKIFRRIKYVRSNKNIKRLKKLWKEQITGSYFDDENKMVEIMEARLYFDVLTLVVEYDLDSVDKLNENNFYQSVKNYINQLKKEDEKYFLSNIINENNIIFNVNLKCCSNEQEKIYLPFLKSIANKLFSTNIKNKRSIYNDFIDYLNFSRAYKNNFEYITCDKSQIALYDKIYVNDIQLENFVTRCKNNLIN